MLKVIDSNNIKIGKIKISCVILGDGSRVLIKSDFLRALGFVDENNLSHWELSTFISSNHLKPYVSKDLLKYCKPVEFEMHNGSINYGYRLRLLPRLWCLYFTVNMQIVLNKQEQRIYDLCGDISIGLTMKIQKYWKRKKRKKRKKKKDWLK